MKSLGIVMTGVIFSSLFLFFTGCSDHYRLSGKVTFQDGKPVTRGMILFTTDSFQAKGEIRSDGSYTVGSEKKNNGIPKGDYKVSVTGVTKQVPGMGGMSSYIPLCDIKYENTRTSGLTCSVPAPGNKFDIVLDPHPKNYP